jgi:3-oxocholest-4-en-26-oyl-CoA dehydrogenase beta subunit
MDFNLTQEQNILKDTARSFLSKECPTQLVRKLEESETGLSRDLWQKMAGLGWQGLVIPEEYGGSGGSFLDLTILLEEMGYHLCSGPFLSTVVLGCLPILHAGSDDLKNTFLPRIARGEVLITLAMTEPSADFTASSIKVHARPDDEGFLINGTKLFVPDANNADYLLCVARTNQGNQPERGITVFILDAKCPGIRQTQLKTLAGDKQSEVVFENVRARKDLILGGVDQGWPISLDTMQKASVALSAQMIGGAQAVMDMCLEHAKQRTQFNRAIGSFQALQHYFADMWIYISGSRYLIHKAAWKISRGIPAALEVSMAKSHAGHTYRRVTILGHQIFGGIGFTKEHDLHLYHKRSITGDSSFGDAGCHNQIVAHELGLS